MRADALPRIFLSAPHVGAEERALLLDAFDSNWIAPLGPHVDAFEREFEARMGWGHAAALSSGTAALQLGLEILGVGNGDRVLCATLTFAATANAIVYRGATPVFVDCDATWTMDPALVAAELERTAGTPSHPKAVVPVDLYGQCADYDALRKICERYGVPILEDAAEALGSTHRGKPAGTLGAMAAFSFNGNKIITTSGGGMLLCAKKEWADRARFLATQARDPADHYEHSTVGYNFRLSNLLAAVGRGQLRRLDERVAARRANHDFYAELFAGVEGLRLMPETAWCRSNRWLTCALFQPDVAPISREKARLALAEANIESRPVWKPMHLQPVFRDAPYVGGALASTMFETGLALPSGSNMTDADRERIRRAFESLLGRS